MAIVVESVATGQSPITKPTGLAVGDLMVAVVSQIYNGAFPYGSTPSGWTEMARGYDNRAFGLYWKVADSSDVAASTFAFQDTGGGHMYGVLYRISGYANNAYAAFEIFNGDDNSGDVNGLVATGITPAHSGSLFIAGYMVGDNTTNGTNSTYELGGSPTFTERYDAALDYRTTFSVADAPIPNTTACGNATVVTTATTPEKIKIIGMLIYAKVDAVADPAHLSLNPPHIYQTIPQMIRATPTVYPCTPVLVTPTWTNEDKHAATGVTNIDKS